MKRCHLVSGKAGLVVILPAFLPSAVHACTVCMGDPSSKTAGAMNAAIFLMIGFVALMMGSFGSFAWYLSRRVSTGSIVPHPDAPESSDEPDHHR